MNGLQEFLVMGIPIAIVVPALVQQEKSFGLADRFAGAAAMFNAFAIVVLVRAAAHEFALADIAAYLLAGVVYGLASAGAYSQVKALGGA